MSNWSVIGFQVKEAEGPAISRPSAFAEEFAELRELDRETFHVVTLNQKNKIIGKHLVSVGTLTATLVHPREVYKPAILESAAAVAFVHNHPSGDPAPSELDRTLTTRLGEAGHILGIRVLDHVIIGRDSYYAFSEGGQLEAWTPW